VSIPLYKRRWFKLGMLFVIIGVFSYGLAAVQTAKYEKEFPHLSKNDRELFLEKVNSNETADLSEMSKEEKDRLQNVTMLHGLYQTYTYVGWVFIILGIICMLLSTKEPQVPVLENEEDENGT